MINGSQELQNTLDKHAIQSSRKRSHVNRETNGWYRLEFPEGADLKIICTDLLTCPDIRYAILNHYGVLYSEPNDTLYQAGDQWVLEKIQMDLCWDLAKPDQTILVGIIDYGMDYDHEDLSDNVWANPGEISGDSTDNDNNGFIDNTMGWDFVYNDNNPMDTVGYDNCIDYYGTGVAGIVGAKTYNTIGVAGIAGGWLNQSGVKLVP